MADQTDAAALIDAERSRRARDACCKATGDCGSLDCQIASAVDDVLADMADAVRSYAAPIPDARERLARHLYIAGWASERTAAQRWDAGEVPVDRVADYRRAADQTLAVITGQEG